MYEPVAARRWLALLICMGLAASNAHVAMMMSTMDNSCTPVVAVTSPAITYTMMLRWDAVYIMAYTFTQVVSGMWLSALHEDAISLVSVGSGSAMLFVGVLAALSMDAVPRSLIPRRAQLVWLAACALLEAWEGLAFAFLLTVDEPVCVLVSCVSLRNVLANSTFTVALFFCRFAVMLWLRPKQALLLRAHVDVE